MRISVACDIVEITQLCNNHNDDNDDNMMHACVCVCARVWFAFFGGLFQCQNL